MRIVQNDLPCGPFRPGFFSCEIFSRAGLFLYARHPSVRDFFLFVRGFPLCGVPSVRGSFRAGFFSVRGSFPCGAFSCAGLLPCGVLFRHPDWCDRRAGSRMLRAAPSIIPCPGACRRARPGVPRVEPFPACLPAGGRCRALFSACCVRALVRAGPSFPRSVFDSLLKSPGPVLGIPPNFSYLWMQKMSFAALKTYRAE